MGHRFGQSPGRCNERNSTCLKHNFRSIQTLRNFLIRKGVNGRDGWSGFLGRVVPMTELCYATISLYKTVKVDRRIKEYLRPGSAGGKLLLNVMGPG